MFEKRVKMGLLSVISTITLMAGILLASPLVMTSFAQAQQQAVPDLTAEEEQIQNDIIQTQALALNRLAVVDANQNTDDFRSRWSQVAWIEPDSTAAIFVDCLPGTYPQGAQEIFSSSELQLLQSFAVGLSENVYSWLAVVQNEDEDERHAAAIGAICEGDTIDNIELTNTAFLFDIDQTNIIANIQNIINIKQNITVISPTNNTGTVGGNTTDPETVGGNTTDTETPPPTGGASNTTEGGTTTEGGNN
ncbi:MAG TPA: hypothetical protein VHF65_07725 [Nitrososphaera sp.]|nr:hypothetical protein [Nitrososphaera sp.]